MNSEPQYARNLETAKAPTTTDEAIQLQKKHGFNYRQAIGELLYAMVTCRPDIAYPTIKLSQYSTNPAEAHYEAVKDIFYYLQDTVDKGITYWRQEANNDLPIGETPQLKSDEQERGAENKTPTNKHITGSVDSDWAGDNTHRRSVTGYTVELAGGSIYYKSKFQDTISTSSCEAEFTAATEAAKSICYVRSILDEINIPQDAATTLFIDNQGALLMADAKQPTRRTRHMDIKHFKIQEWVERDIITMRRIDTKENRSDAMTKALNSTLFYRHMDKIMGNYIPTYVKLEEQQKVGGENPPPARAAPSSSSLQRERREQHKRSSTQLVSSST